ncbi:aminomethyl-transferring glycine dehydrogenase subunit GcvPA [Roseimaritima sediminicola]|uniref:aminomethyl-transferring glycine dehydrogenase subunit GcvPA n=1 Tax=Roseimaritima sediminicola TaxID=2662066 RepID=UPI0012984A01|nr:aminomethyl-transferring glycine dehydrogenase subunit GcvPA [Roseimaritima sediminicola]
MYLFHTEADRRAMLDAIGAASMEEILRQQIPADARFQRPLELPPAVSEMQLQRDVTRAAAENASTASHVCFMGAGAYDHFVPAAVDAIASRGEFYTSYTPYQAEVSQGNLQAMFEYETLITQLTGLDVSNASLYDGGTAAVEAVIMALSVGKGRRRVVTSATVHPEYRQILETYLHALDCELVIAPLDESATAENLLPLIDDDTACVLVQHPNFFGHLEDVRTISDKAHEAGALVVQVFDPISMGLLKRPGDLGVDIAVAEGQCLGNPLAFGGPYLGVMACRQDLVRRLPGRIAGQTVDRRGNRCWVLTLQTREQHIRREKATSNICSNQTLLALRATVYLSLLGPQGLLETAQHCHQKTAYARQQLAGIERLELPFEGPVFKEFVVRDRERDVIGLNRTLREQGILMGVPLERWYPELEDCFLVAVTEQRTRADIDALAGALSNAPTQGVTAGA